MTVIEKYQEISKWVDIFHKRDIFRTGLLSDMKHDIWLKVREKEINVAYIKEISKQYPRFAIQHVYYRRTSRGADKQKREVVLLDDEGNYVDFPDYAFEVEIETPKVKKSAKRRTLTSAQVSEIKQRVSEGKFTTKAALAREYGMTYNKLADLLAGRTYKTVRKLKVHYLNGQIKTFETTTELAETLGLTIKGLRHRIGKPLQGRFTNRKLSHIKLIEWSI
jgi:ribosomal protein S13